MAEVGHFVIPKDLRDKAKKILFLRNESLSSYLRECLSKLVEGTGAEKKADKLGEGPSDGQK